MIGWQRALRLLHSSHPEAFIRRQRPLVLVALIEAARKAELDDRYWQQWLAGYLVYLQGTQEAAFPSFDEYLAIAYGTAKPVDDAAEFDAAAKKAKQAGKRFKRAMAGG